MKRKTLVRFELLALALVTLLLAYRVIEGPPSPSGLVVLDNLQHDEIYHRSFAVSAPSRIAIEAVGSFESDKAEAAMAAYPWLIRREDRRVVWRMNADTVSRTSGTTASARDTLSLEPGTYDAYFVSLGNTRNGGFSFLFLDRIFGGGGAWRDDNRDWRFILRSADGGELAFSSIESQADVELAPAGAELLWSSAPMRGNSRGEHVFLAREQVPIRVYAVGEIDDRQMDYGWIENAVTHARTWEMTLENTRPAGGWHVNRVFDDTIQVEPGIYRAVFETDPRQHYGDWLANPPYDPAAWGMSLFTAREDAVSDFDPWSARTPIIQIMEVGDDERHSAQFQVTSSVQLAAYAVGEMSSKGRYDYAWIRNNDTQETVWEMEYEQSSPAGGHNNRRVLAFLDFPEGTYTVTYETDDSHSYDSWRHGQPEHPERWGVSLFPVAEDFDTSAVQVLGYSEEPLGHRPHPEAPEHPTPPPAPELPPLPGTEIVNLTGLGNEQQVSQQFSLEQSAAIHIRALGEVSLSGRYDYGWIERVDNGEIVWEMNWQNTRPAGGDDINRLFDGSVTLEPGTYVAHYKTDFSHAYGDFGNRAPQNAEAWGIRISR